MTGYVRADTDNSIENGQVANASDLDAEFNAIQTAFSTSSGHTHDGSSAEGAPITVIGPAQDFVATVSAFQPKNGGIYDLGAVSAAFRDGYLTRNFSVGGDLSVTGTLTLTGATTLSTATITDATVTTLNLGGTALTSTAEELNLLDGATVTTSEINHLSGVTSGIQAQINSKQATVTGAATTILSSNLTANRAVVSNGSGKLTASGVTTTELNRLSGIAVSTTELNHLSGVTSNIQTQLNSIISGGFPTGGIVMWSGSVAAIPSGWALCNGSSGTPDLRGRMVIGAGGSFAVDATGGSQTVTLSEANLPAHTHTFSGTTSGHSNDHSHSGTTEGGGAHSHTVTTVSGGSSTDVSAIQTSLTPGTTTFPTSSVGNHTHTFTTSGVDSDHTHTFSGTTSSIGSGSAINILNPYYALAFIMKL